MFGEKQSHGQTGMFWCHPPGISETNQRRSICDRRSAQIVGHMALVAELKTLESRSPKDFQKVIREATASVEGHMQKAVSICKSLDNQTEETETNNR